MEQGRHETTQPKQTASAARKKSRKKMTGSMVLVYILFILGVSMLISAVAIVCANDVFAFVKNDESIVVEFPEGASIGEVAQLLDETGVVKYGGLFSLFTRLSDGDIEFAMGSFELNSKMDYRAILNSIRKSASNRAVVSITIPEGYTVSQIKDMLLEEKVCEEAALVEALSNYDYDYDFLEGLDFGSENRLEGFLFPDTYQFYVGDDAVGVIRRMLENFSNKFDENMREQAADLGYTVAEIVNIAAMVEKEAMLDEERAVIAGVIYNRLASADFPYLNIDATVQYAVGHKEQLTREDLQVDSPYNTYVYRGLPAGPIANPGYDCLYAALNPESHGYYYYVARSDGSHIFSRTLSEHNAAIASVS